MPFEYASPAQIMRKVSGGHPMERDHPVFQSAVVGVDILNMKGPIHPALLPEVYRAMGYSLFRNVAVNSY